MTQERKDQLYDEMFGWICERCEDSHELYTLLHEQFGMSKEELHDHCIESLDEYFPEEDVRTQLKRKVTSCFEEHRERWLKMDAETLIANADEIGVMSHMVNVIPGYASEQDAEYLLRFKDPLEVVAFQWLDRNGMEAMMNGDEVYDTLWELRDKQDAEGDYEMEPEFYDAPDPPTPQIAPQMTM